MAKWEDIAAAYPYTVVTVNKGGTILVKPHFIKNAFGLSCNHGHMLSQNISYGT